MTMPDGKSRIGTVRAGQTIWEAAGSHQPENISDQPFDAIRTELKNPQDCTKYPLPLAWVLIFVLKSVKCAGQE